MERKTLLIFNSVAVATTMLASAARADDSGRTSGTTTSPSMTTSPSTSPNPSIAPSSGSTTPSTIPPSTPSTGYGVTSQGSQGMTQGTTSVQTTTMDAAPPVGTTRLTSSDAAIIGNPAATESRDSVTVYRKTRPNPALLVTGTVLLAGTYVPTAIVAAESDRQADKNLYIPIVGPWLNLADRQCSGCDNETRNVTLVVGSGILQGLGAGMMLASFLVPQKVEAATIQAGNVKMHVLPTQMGRGGAGVGAVGTF